MTFNIFEGAEETLPAVIHVVNSIKPDFLAIQEANGFEKDNQRLLKYLSEQLGLPYFEIALSREFDFHVASYSKYPFKAVNRLSGFRNACLQTIIQTELGELAICNTHLTPYNEDERLLEITRVVKAQEPFMNKIIVGDLNSISPEDGYDLGMVKNFTAGQLRKFTKDNQLQFEVINRLLGTGYADTIVMQGNCQHTVPTKFNDLEYPHPLMRLDYIFTSESLIGHLQGAEIVKNDITDQASDHYPVLATII